MAGIGFKLRAYTEEGTLSGLFVGYAGAALIATGPWIITVATLLVTAAMADAIVPDLSIFKVMMVYTYAFSLIFTGALQNVVTRYIADCLYRNDVEHHLPSLVSVFMLTVPAEMALSAIFYAFMPIPALYKVVGVVFFVLVSSIWMVMIFVGAVQAHVPIVTAFAVGAGVSILTIVALVPRLGEMGFMLGYCCGQLAILLLLLHLLREEFDLSTPWDFGFVGYFRRYPWLALTGLAFYLAMWADKLVYWMSPFGETIHGFRGYPEYDMASLLGQLTIIPAITVFFVRVETEFYEEYHAFFGGILAKAGLGELTRRKQSMMRVLRTGFVDILKVQGLVTLAIVFEAEKIFRFLYLSPHGYNLVRMCALGAFFQCVFLLINVIKFYYEAYKEAFIGAATFLAGNVIVSVLTVPDPSIHGLGLVIGGLLGSVVGLRLLLPLLRDLEFFTFSRQPMPGQLSLDPLMLAGKDSFGQYIIRDGELQVKVHQPGAK